ncbi:hypothetical protein ACF3MZ_20245 [Paenibacillaceae bacterium WGS1546]|uniref:hypothetical protein n=1 Tax=Cohnella sp. WGS1546 TaxID=3366810 RepID=UPI00372D335E
MVNRRVSKPLLAIAFVLLMIVLVTLANNPMGKSQPEEITESNPHQHIGSALSAVKFETLDDYIGYADHIVYGKLISSSKFDESTSEYVFSVEKQIKGDTASKQINVYYPQGELESGGSYLLFLERFDGGLYPSPEYNILYFDGMFEVDNDGTAHPNRFLTEKLSLDALIAKIKSSPAITKNRIKDDSELAMVVREVATADELAADSDLIAHIQPEYIHVKNKYFVIAAVKVLKTYKGDFNEGWEVVLPSSIEIGKDYLVYLHKKSMAIVTAKTGSVIPMSNEKAWNEALANLE